MRVEPSKEYGDTSTITLRFRTLGMTLSRGKSPQAGRNNLLSTLPPLRPSPRRHSLKQCSFSFIIDPSPRSSPLFLRDHFYQPHDTPSLSLSLSLSLILSRLQRRLIDDHGPSTRLSGRLLPFKFNTLFAPALLARSHLARPPDVFSNFYRRTIIFIWHVSIPNRFIDLWLAFYTADKYPVSAD